MKLIDQPLAQYLGALEGYADGYVLGWAWSSSNHYDKPVIEILVDDFPVGLTRADIYRSDLVNELNGDGCYGYLYKLPSSLLTTKLRITARFANTDIYLERKLAQTNNATQAPPTSDFGCVVADTGLTLTGWCWLNEPQLLGEEIRVHEAGKLICSQALIGTRPAQVGFQIQEKNIGGRYCGFMIHLPLALADGKPHSLDVSISSGLRLQGSPVTVCAIQEGLSSIIAKVNIKPAKPLTQIVEKLAFRLPASVDFVDYPAWYEAFGKVETKKSPLLASKVRQCVIALYGTGNLRATIDSLISQSVEKLHLHSSEEQWSAVQAALNEVRHKRTLFEHISTQTLLNWCGDNTYQDTWIVPVRSGDILLPHAIEQFSSALFQHDASVAYSDTDAISEDHKPAKPWFKPDWDLDLFLAGRLLADGVAFKLGLLNDDTLLNMPIGDWAAHAVQQILQQDVQQSLSVTDKSKNESSAQVKHLPHILYRCGDTKPRSQSAEAIEKCLHTLTTKAVLQTETSVARCGYRVRWPLPDVLPKVSIIIPTRDHADLLDKCLSSLQITDYPALEIVVIDNNSIEPATEKIFKKHKKNINQLIKEPGRFNFSRINNQAVQCASGELLCFLNNDIEVLHPDWLKEMVSQVSRPEVGICGAKLLWPNRMVQHAGVTLGLHGLAGHQGHLWEENDDGYYGYNQIVRQASAVTAACLLMRRSDFLAVGGFDESRFAVAFNDVDLCLKIRALNKRVIWTPYARLIHHESVSRGNDTQPFQAARLEKEKAALRDQWAPLILNDPYYNPNLSLKTFSHAALAFPPRRFGVNHSQELSA
jgi:GT2 family glycosyltransferase